MAGGDHGRWAGSDGSGPTGRYPGESTAHIRPGEHEDVRGEAEDRRGASRRALDPSAVPWGVLDAVGAFVVSAAVTAVVVLLLSLLAAAGALPEAVGPVLLALPLIILAVVTMLWVRVRYPGAVGRLTGTVSGGLREWLLGLVWGVGAFIAVNVVLGVLLQVIAALADVELAQPQQDLQEAATDPGLAPFLFISAVVVAPLTEEVFFRGMLFQALYRRMTRWWAVAASAALFALAHVLQEPTLAAGLLLFGLVFPLGVLLAWLFARRGTLIAPIAVHAVFNLITMLLLLVGQQGGVFHTLAPCC